MADIDDDYEGDLGPLLADLAALRTALGDSYQAYGEINLDDEDINNWQQQVTRAIAPTDAAPRRVLPRKEPAPLIERLAAVTAALEANQSLQQRLQRLISSVNRAQDQAIGIRDRVRASQRRRQVAASAPHALSTRRSDQDQQFTGVSWFWSQPGAPAPPPYLGFHEIKTVVEVLPLVFPRRRWQEEELNALCDGVLQVVQERLLNKILSDLESTPVVHTTTSANGGEGVRAGGVFQAGISLEEFESRQAPIRLLNASSPEVIAIAATLTDTEWATVAHRSVHGRTARECCLAWQNAAMPTISHQKFTDDEDTQLLTLVEQYGTRSWHQIAAELQASSVSTPPPLPPQPTTQPPPSTTTTLPNITTATTTITKRRTSLACMARYQQLLHATRGIQEFTDADRERLIQIVNKVGVQWKRVAEEFGGPWSDDQLMHQWRRHAQRHEGGVDGTPAAAVVPRRGKWLAEEDESLLTAVALYGKKWSHVAKLVPGRSDVQCRERYANCLDPEVNKDPWTDREDEILVENIKHFTNQATRKVKWSSIAELIPGRTDYAVKKRWVALTNAQSRGRGGNGGGGGGDRRGRRNARTAANSQGRNVQDRDSGGGGGAGPSNAVIISEDGQSSGGAKKKESARKKVQKVHSTTQAAAAAAALPSAGAASVKPPPPSEEPSKTRRGRAIIIPTRFAE
jgi:transposase-like protein